MDTWPHGYSYMDTSTYRHRDMETYGQGNIDMRHGQWRHEHEHDKTCGVVILTNCDVRDQQK